MLNKMLARARPSEAKSRKIEIKTKLRKIIGPIDNKMIIQEKTSLGDLNLGPMAKVVIDTERKVISINCELHIDCADELVKNGSQSKNLWGANIYPQEQKIDFVSLINIKPRDDNRSMEIQDPLVRQKVEEVIGKLLF